MSQYFIKWCTSGTHWTTHMCAKGGEVLPKQNEKCPWQSDTNINYLFDVLCISHGSVIGFVLCFSSPKTDEDTEVFTLQILTLKGLQSGRQQILKQAKENSLSRSLQWLFPSATLINTSGFYFYSPKSHSSKI